VDVEANARARVEELFVALVARPSENPPGAEQAVADLVSEALNAAGFSVENAARVPHRPNVVGRLQRGVGKVLILQGHADTKPAVYPGTENLWESDPFHVTHRQGRLYGLGACDTKGGLAAQLACAATLAADPSWCGELVVQAVADEEDGSRHGAEYLLERGDLRADAAIVAEPTSCAPSVAQLGNAWAEVNVRGRAAHAGSPDQGHDAFGAALGFIDILRGMLADLPTSPDFPGHPTLNVGDVLVPGHPGTVPGQCRLRCDIRVLPGQRHDDVFQCYLDAAAQAAVAGLHVEVTPYQGGGCQSHQIDPNHPIVDALQAARLACGQPPATTPFLGGTDARYFAMAGTPAVVYGPGSLRQAHAPNEYVDRLELLTAAQQITHAARKFLGRPSNSSELRRT
jgi:succinyl-diaminopimelate desuccinylase